MLLGSKRAVIYGGGGSSGGAVARAFAREGARVFLAGRTRATLEDVAEEIRSAGGAVETAEVDALDEEAVGRHADGVAAEAEAIGISFNVVAHPYTHGTPLADMAVDDFMAPVRIAARTTFLTVRAAARHMIPRRSGVILAFGGPGDRSAPMRDYYFGGTQVAFYLIEGQSLMSHAMVARSVAPPRHVAIVAYFEPAWRGKPRDGVDVSPVDTEILDTSRRKCLKRQKGRDMQLREMDEQVSYASQLHEEGGPVVLINVFNVAPGTRTSCVRPGQTTPRS